MSPGVTAVVLGIGGLFIIYLALRSLARHRRHAGRAEERLRSAFRSENPPREYTFQRLYEVVEPPSPEWLALALARTFEERLDWRLVFRVVFPDWSTRFSDFTSLEGIPEAIEMSEGGSFLVEPHLVKIVFKNDRFRDDGPGSSPSSPPPPSKGRAAVVTRPAAAPTPATPPKPAAAPRPVAAPEPVKVPEPVAMLHE
jgi:hypothetical protein